MRRLLALALSALLAACTVPPTTTTGSTAAAKPRLVVFLVVDGLPVKAGRRDTRVEVVDIAPTLAQVLGVPPPAASEGKALPLR